MTISRITPALSQFRQLVRPGGPVNYGPDLTRLLVQVLRVLAGVAGSPRSKGTRLPRTWDSSERTPSASSIR